MAAEKLFKVDDVLQLGFSHYIIFSLSVVAIAWGSLLYVQINNLAKNMDGRKVTPNTDEKEKAEDMAGDRIFPWTGEDCYKQMQECNKYIKDGARSFLKQEYLILIIFCIIFAVVLFVAVDQSWKADLGYPPVPYTTICFLVGALTSMLSGYIGMMVATTSNVVTTYMCCEDTNKGFNVAYKGGQVLGFCLVGFALLILEVLILSFKGVVMNGLGDGPHTKKQLQHQTQVLFEMISGYGLGGSTVALFGRVGGGIYTKAADVGADLAGKVINNLPEDSPFNPGTIADNVGDNVGDIAGMGADLFGSLAESTCAALVVSGTSWELISFEGGVYFPLLVTAVGIGASFITVQLCGLFQNVETKLRGQLIISTILMSVCIVPLLWCLPEYLNIRFAGNSFPASRIEIYGCIMMGLWSGLLIGLSTEYYTSHSYAPTRSLAKACLQDAAPNIILGLALGYMSNVIPICCLAVTVLLSFHWAAMYGVALAALGMLGCLPVCLSVDGYGPISDNAGGIAEMCNLEESVRKRTDLLDAAGNTTAAIGKGFAIGSACLVALALFGAYITRVAETDATAFNVNILEPYTFAGLLFGAMLPYFFSALTMAAVGSAANDMIDEIQRQIFYMQDFIAARPDKRAGYFVKIEKKDFDTNFNEVFPNHDSCVKISTTASLRKMIAPGCIVILSPLIFGALFGHRFVSGMLAGTITSGIQIAFSASNTGGAWDNCKKYIEAQHQARTADGIMNKARTEGFKTEALDKIKLEHDAKIKECKKNGGKGLKEAEESRLKDLQKEFAEIAFVKKKDAEHKNAVIGDTVGDPLKDTSGPAINILIKLMAITSLVFGSFIATSGGLITGNNMSH